MTNPLYYIAVLIGIGIAGIFLTNQGLVNVPHQSRPNRSILASQ